MKNYLLLCLAGSISFAALIYFYLDGEYPIVRNGHRIAETLLLAKKSDSELERNLLKARGFIDPSYDALVSSEVEINEVCLKLKSVGLGLYGEARGGTRKAIDAYCTHQKLKSLDVERFKTKNAIFRNSLFFLQKLSNDTALSLEPAIPDPHDKLRAELISLGLSYALLPTADSMIALISAIEKESTVAQPSSDLQSVAAHAQRIYETKEELEKLIERILSSRSGELLKKISELYSVEYKKTTQAASIYRTVVFCLCGAMLIVIGFGIVRMWNSKKALFEANTNLELRVAARTHELEQAQQIVTRQQEVLAASTKMSALGEMAGGVAHEINTPLAIILMRAEQMEECINDGDLESIDFLDAIEIIKRTTDRIAKIVSGLRTFAREGKNEPLRTVLIKPMIDETLSFCKERFANYGVGLELVFPAGFDSIQVMGRSIELSQVLLNLLNNSFDAVQTSSEKWVRIEITEHRNQIELSVTDSGAGIAPEHRQKVMQPFFTTKEVGKGTGLGLSISRGLIHAHGGSLELDTAAANTRFVISLPNVSPIQTSDVAV